MPTTLIEITGVSPASASVVPKNKPFTTSWTIGPNQVNPSYHPTQGSARLGWTMDSEGSYTYIDIAGSSQNYTFPANFFPQTGTVYLSLEVTDISGTWNYKNYSYKIGTLVELSMVSGAGIDEYEPDSTFPWTDNIQYISRTSTGYFDKCSIFMFQSAPSEYKYKAIFNAGIYAKISKSSGNIGGEIRELSAIFNHNTVTWNTKPTVLGKIKDWSLTSEILSGTMQQLPTCYWGYPNAGENSPGAAKMAKAKALMVSGPLSSSSLSRWVSLRDPVSLRLWFLDEAVYSKPQGTSKISGYVNPHILQTFTWDLVPSGDFSCYGTWEQVSAVFHWRNGDSGNWTDEIIGGDVKQVNIAAESFTVGTAQWYVTATDNEGTTASSDIYTISTEDSITSALPTAPINTVEDGSGSIELFWTVFNDHGTSQSGADLEYSTDGVTWVALGSVTGANTSYTVAADTFQAGNIYWRVRAYNADSVAGEWSDAVSFLSINAPADPVVSVTPVPFAVVTWQSEGQQSWRLTVDGVTVYGPYFGKDQRFELPDYLSNGEHTIALEVLGTYGLWSKPGVATVQIVNEPGIPIVLSGEYGKDAELTWESESEIQDYLIYRDGKQIGKTVLNSFTDRTVLGSHVWQVINRLPSGNYMESNVISGTLVTPSLSLALLSGGEWLDLPKSASDLRSVGSIKNQTISLIQFAGQEYPETEVSPYKTEQISFDVAWTYDEATNANRFEAMLGLPVICKTPCGYAVVGMITAWERQNNYFYKTYSATVQRIQWRDFVNENG